MEDRQEFEKWAKSVNLKAERWKVDPNRYVSDEAHFAWMAWQARTAQVEALQQEISDLKFEFDLMGGTRE